MEDSTRLLFQKTVEGWTLRRGRDRKCELEQADGRKLIYQWTEWDRHRIVWADGGCLRAVHVGNEQLEPARTLYDFNDRVPR